ncbi:MAG: ABC transporter substrate-binding protein [Acidimicrobiales bacterium]|jgi:peptide/nickel transport system substrate-binding protein
MQLRTKLRLLVSLGTVAGAMTIGLVAPTVGGAASAKVSTASNTITFAEGAGAAPNYIFPYLGCQYFSVATLSQFQELTYRPVYWFGTPGSSAVDYSLSPAKAPVFSNGNKTITIDMKGWKFADGQTVNAQSVMFFLNLYKADPTSYCGYNKGYGIPDQVASASGKGNTVTIKFTGSVNPNWILYNYLAELTPMPNSWDITAPGKTSTCATGVYGSAATDTACKAVEKYLDGQAATMTDFSDTLWTSGADGPWKLSKMDDLGNATFIPNSTYSGPVKAQKGIDFVKEDAFTTENAEETALRGGSITIGTVDPTELTANAPAPLKTGANWSAISSNYTLATGSTWAFNYAPFNFSSKDPKHAIVSQLYIRQALQEAVDQTAILQKVDKGYGVPIDSPLPPNTPESVSGLAKALEPVPNPYPFNLSSAKKLLTSHGWKLVGGVDACESPGTGASDCGAGIPKGDTLNLSILWASGTPALDDTFNAEVADWDSIGFKFAHTEATFNDVIADCEAGTKYELCSWGGGWSYAPDYYPSGETLFAPGGGFNVGGYANATETSDIKATTFGTASLKAFAEYTAKELPVLFQPQADPTIEYSNKLSAIKVNGIGGLVQNPLQNFMPEYMKLS